MPPETPPIAPPPEPSDVGFVAALPIEVGKLISTFRDVRKYSSENHSVVEAECGGRLVSLIVAGMGRSAARRGAELLIAGHRPRWIISAGFGGALDPALKRNDVILADEVVDLDGFRVAIDVRADDPGVRTGRLVTVDEIARTVAEKAELREKTGADVVDMETAAVASLCADRGIRFLSLRVVSDEAGRELPKEIAAILGRTGGYRIGAAIGSIWKRPGSLFDMLELREHALSAADKLAEVLPAILSKLA